MKGHHVVWATLLCALVAVGYETTDAVMKKAEEPKAYDPEVVEVEVLSVLRTPPRAMLSDIRVVQDAARGVTCWVTAHGISCLRDRPQAAEAAGPWKRLADDTDCRRTKHGFECEAWPTINVGVLRVSKPPKKEGSK